MRDNDATVLCLRCGSAMAGQRTGTGAHELVCTNTMCGVRRAALQGGELVYSGIARARAALAEARQRLDAQQPPEGTPDER